MTLVAFTLFVSAALSACRDSSSASRTHHDVPGAPPAQSESPAPLTPSMPTPHEPRTQPTTHLANDLREEVVRIPLPDHAGETLEATIFRPQGDGPFPLLVMNHGAIGKRDPAPRWRPLAHARWFVSRGFVVAVPMRRGNAGSDGDWAEGYGPCANAEFSSANRESASDIRAAVSFLAKKPYVDPHRVLLHGLSAGGMAALTLASNASNASDASNASSIAGVNIVGVLNFAGGRGSLTSDDGATRHNCNPDALVAAVEKFGETIRVPTLWLYAENDHFFPPPLAHRMFEAFTSHAKNGTFVAIPAFADEGHKMTWEAAAIPLWENDVARFLTRVGLAK